MRVKVPTERVSDLLYNAEELYNGLLTAELWEEADSMYQVVRGLRDRVREEQGE